MKNILVALLLMFSVNAFSQSFDESKLTKKQKQELAIHTEDCRKTTVIYTDEQGNKFPVYYDPATKCTFYVQVYKKHVLTVDLERRVVYVD